MGLLTARGNEAAEAAAQDNGVDLSKVMIRLKDGESLKVRLLTAEDFAEYEAISDFELKVYSQPTRQPLGEKDYFVEAGKLAEQGKVDEKFKKLYPRKRYLIAFADVKSGELRIWDASKGQFNDFLAAVKEYEEVINDPDSELLFNFKRTGEKLKTSYSLTPIIKKLSAADSEAYHQFDGQEVTEDFFESVLRPRSAKLQVKVLQEAGFPVDEHFPEIDLSDEEAATTDASPLEDI